MWKIKIWNEPSLTKEDKIFENLKLAIEMGGYPAAKELCRNTTGKVAYHLYRFIDEVLEK